MAKDNGSRLVVDTSHIPNDVLCHFEKAKNTVLAWTSVFILIPSFLAWGSGHTYFSYLGIYETIVSFLYWITWRRGHPLRIADMAGAAVIMFWTGYLAYGKQPDPVSSMIWWALCVGPVFFWYYNSLQALNEWKTIDRHVHELHYHMNFRASAMMAGVFVLSETTWDAFLLHGVACVLIMQVVIFYALDMSMAYYRAVLTVGFPNTFIWSVIGVVAVYFKLFATDELTSTTTSAHATFSFYYQAALLTILAILALHGVLFRLLAPLITGRRYGELKSILKHDD